MIIRIKKTIRAYNNNGSRNREKLTIILGDWSNNGSLKYISTPNNRYRKLLAQHFNVYLIDEFHTSKINCKTQC